MKIEIDDLSRPAIHALLNEHLQNMYELSPPESVHALDLEKLRKPEITFWSAWEGSLLLGCGALKELDRKHGEVKSMRTPTALRRKGALRIRNDDAGAGREFTRTLRGLRVRDDRELWDVLFHQREFFFGVRNLARLKNFQL